MRNVLSEKFINDFKEFAKQSKNIADDLVAELFVAQGMDDIEVELTKEECLEETMQIWKETFRLLKEAEMISDEDYLKLLRCIK